MPPGMEWTSGAASDTGLLRGRNEDRYFLDDEHGIFLVADGVGGHAAGEMAAETAVAVIREELLAHRGPGEERVRRAIAAANNEIYERAQKAGQCHGMACVLTLALVEGDEITIGHVGDSRLYLVWNDVMRKLTFDHSPVGEGEDSGELTEEEAMLHPRRNEVFRDVGSRPHGAHDRDFIEIRRCRFRPDAAILLCSDGLSDLLTSAEMRAVISEYEGDAAAVARALVDAANEAGGKDNITALFVAGPDFHGRAPARHAVTRERIAGPQPAPSRWRLFTGRVAFLLYGMAIGMAVWAVIR